MESAGGYKRRRRQCTVDVKMLRTELRLVLVGLLIAFISVAVVLARPKDVAKRQARNGDIFLCSLFCESGEDSSEEGCEWLDYLDSLCEPCKSSSTTRKPVKTATKSPPGSSNQLGGSTSPPPQSSVTSPSPSVTPQTSSASSALPLGASSTTSDGATTGTGTGTAGSSTTPDGKAESTTEAKKARGVDDATEAPLPPAAKDRLLQYLPQMLDFWCDWTELFPKPDSAAARATLCPLRTGPVNGTRLDPPALLDLILSDLNPNWNDDKIEEFIFN